MAMASVADGDRGSLQAPLMAVELAERRRYAALTQALALRPRLARATDDFGMTPLHWVCNDASVPLHVLNRVVLAHPPATTARNLAGLLPLHLAVRKRLPLEALRSLLKFYAKAAVIATPDGKLPTRLAKEAGADRETVDYLRGLEGEVCALAQSDQGHETRRSAGHYRASDCRNRSSGEESDGVGNYGSIIGGFDESGELATGAIHFRDDNQLGDSISTSYSGDANPMTIAPVTALMTSGKINLSLPPVPPEWKHASKCRICDARFGYLRGRRHHCRNCGDSVCGRHSHHAVPLKHLGLFSPQRVCTACFDGIQEHYTARALAKVAPLERLGGFTVPIVPMTASSPHFNKFQRSRSVFNELPAIMATAPCCTSLSTSPPRSDNGRGGYKPFSSTFSAMPMQDIDSIHLARVKRNYQLGLAMQNGGGAIALPREQQQRQQERKNVSTADRTVKPDRTLAITELMTHSTAWHEFELDAVGATSTSASMGDSSALSRAASPMTMPVLSSRRRLKTSMDSQVLELEAQMERLLVARRRISVALKNSQRQIARARREKHELDEVARKFRDLDYPSDHEEDGDLAHASGCDSYDFANGDDEEEDAHGNASDHDEHDDSCRLNSRGSTALTTATTATTTTSDNEYEDVPHENARYCDDSYEEGSTDDDDDATTYIIKHPARVLPLRRPRRPPPRPPTPRLTPALSDSHRCFQSMEPPTLDMAETHAGLGSALLASGKSSAAAAAFRDALRLDSDNADVWHQLATALDAVGDRQKEAEEAARCAVELQPASLASLSLLGKLLHARGEHDEAISVFRRALALQKS